MNPRASIKALIFSDDTPVELGQDDIVVIVGPNNAGKSAALRGIRDKFINRNAASVVIKFIAMATEGTVDDLLAWLENTTRKNTSNPQDPIFNAMGAGIYKSQASGQWQNPANGFQSLARFFCFMLTADARLQAADPAPNIPIIREPPSHPIHYLQINDSLETRLSSQFQRAFGTELIVHRNAGNEVPLYTGERPKPGPGQDRVSYQYIQALEALTPLKMQGDGMRSFAGVLLYTSTGRESVFLIDEPEAFLHPPQARLLGRMLVQEKQAERQLFIATHSGDVLRGILDIGSANVRVIRLRREGNVNITRVLNNAEIATLWNDPILRYSNILDGLFHEKVIVCEGDSDCRFYAAVADALYKAKGADVHQPDIMFVHVGGKARIATILRALAQVSVPVATILDFDALNEETILSGVVQAIGGEWASLEADWKVVKQAIDSKKPELSADEVRTQVETVLASVGTGIFPDDAKNKIISILRRASPWQYAKEVGMQYVPSGTPSEALQRLMKKLQAIGVFLVEVGELEGLCKTVGRHGPAWVNEVLKRDLSTDPELDKARRFVQTVIGLSEQ